jgi:hypothetical protein
VQISRSSVQPFTLRDKPSIDVLAVTAAPERKTYSTTAVKIPKTSKVATRVREASNTYQDIAMIATATKTEIVKP